MTGVDGVRLVHRIETLGDSGCRSDGLQGAGGSPRRPITVAPFTNEEGIRYTPDMMGSLVHAGGLSSQAGLQTRGTDD